MRVHAFIIAVSMLLVGCASTPKPVSAESVPMDDRSRFIEASERQLSQWEQVLEDLDARSSDQFQPLVGDLRANLLAMKRSPRDQWYVYRPRVERSLTEIHRQYVMEAE